MNTRTDTTRRSFLKAGALVAAPVAAAGIPVAALAADDSAAALARLQDERAIEALGREFLRAFNNGGKGAAASQLAQRTAKGLAGITRLWLDEAEDAARVSLAEDGTTAVAQFACMADHAEDLAGDETIVRMARMQGNAAAVTSSRKTLTARYVRSADGWKIEQIELA